MMNTNMLIDELPEAVEVSGVLLPIETSFRTYILIELLFNDNDVAPEEKTLKALELVYGEIPAEIDAAVEAMLWFYRGGKPFPRRGKGENRVTRIFDYDQDDGYIYAAFLSQYDIDLNDIADMHWWKFRALLHSLTDDNEIVKIMGYRSVDLSKIKDKDRRMEMAQLKAMYQIRENLSEEQKAERISSQMGGAV